MTHTDLQALGLSFEYFPPSNSKSASKLWQAVARHASYDPDFVSVTFGAGGSDRTRTIETLKRFSQLGRPPVAGHLTMTGASRDEVLDTADQYRALNVEHIVALRGDAPKDAKTWQPHPNGFENSLDFIHSLAKKGFSISVAAYPEMHPDADNWQDSITYLKAKFDAGATRALTQFFFEKDHFLRFRDAADKAGITQPIIPGIFPVRNIERAVKFANRCGANVPNWMCDAYRNTQTESERDLLAVSLACDLIENLRCEGVGDFHIYTMNDPEIPAKICQALGRHPHQAQLHQVA